MWFLQLQVPLWHARGRANTCPEGQMCSAGNVRVSLEEEFFQFILADNSFDFPQSQRMGNRRLKRNRLHVLRSATGVAPGERFHLFAISRVLVTCKELCGQNHNAKRSYCHHIPHFFIVEVQPRACVAIPPAKLDHAGQRVSVESRSPTVLEVLKEGVCTVRSFDFSGHFRNAEGELTVLFKLEDLLVCCTGNYP